MSESSSSEMRLISTVNAAFRKGGNGESAGNHGIFGSVGSSSAKDGKTIVATGDWKSKCESVLVPTSECRPPRSAALTGRLSKSFPLRLGNGSSSQKRTKPDGSERRLQWAQAVDEAYNARKHAQQQAGSIQASTQSFSPYVNRRLRRMGGLSGPPRRLTLHEKVDLYTERPDLDLAGIMPRLEAIRRMERMSAMPTPPASKPSVFDDDDSNSDDDDQDDAEDKTIAEAKMDEEKADDAEEKKVEDSEEKREDQDVEMSDGEDVAALSSIPSSGSFSVSNAASTSSVSEEKICDLAPMADSDDEESRPKVGIDSESDSDSDSDSDSGLEPEQDHDGARNGEASTSSGQQFGQDRYEEQRRTTAASVAGLSRRASTSALASSAGGANKSSSLALKKQRLQRPARGELARSHSRYRYQTGPLSSPGGAHSGGMR